MKKTNKYSFGIFGGTFDPPHKGHLKLSLIGLKKLKLQKVYWVVTKKNPFKKKSFLPLKTRISRCKKITKNIKKITTIYLDDKIKSSRTIKIINFLKKKNKLSNFFLFIGLYNLINFHKWRDWKKILKICKLVVFDRKGYDNKAKKSHIIKYVGKKNIIFVKNKKIDISSTQLRYKLKK